MTHITVNSLQNILKFTYGIVPIAAGLDKFLNILTDWTQYVSNGMASLIPFSPAAFMMIVGIIEIIAGILVLTYTKIGAYIVSGWLVCIALVLLLSGQFMDVAVRDIVMAVGAYTLAGLTQTVESINKN